MAYICYGPLILFKAIFRDILVTQSANMHDNEDVLKLQLCISATAHSLAFLPLSQTET